MFGISCDPLLNNRIKYKVELLGPYLNGFNYSNSKDYFNKVPFVIILAAE